MIVCVCNNVNFYQAMRMIQSHDITTLDELKAEMDICNECETCEFELQNLIDIERGPRPYV